MNSVGHHVRAMIVLPVQELAVQVSKVFKKYCTNTGLKVVLLSASTPLRKEQQQIVRYSELQITCLGFLDTSYHFKLV